MQKLLLIGESSFVNQGQSVDSLHHFSWGYRGHFRLERGADACQVESHASAATFGSQMSTATLFDLQQQQQQQGPQHY